MSDFIMNVLYVRMSVYVFFYGGVDFFEYIYNDSFIFFCFFNGFFDFLFNFLFYIWFNFFFFNFKNFLFNFKNRIRLSLSCKEKYIKNCIFFI